MIKQIARFCKLKVTAICGRRTFKEEIEQLQEGYDILVMTPLRMQNHLERKNFFLSQLRYFVIDESDTLIDAGFKDYL